MMNMMQVMNSKCKRNNNTSASNTNRVRVREKGNLKKEIFFFDVQAQSSTSPPLSCEGFHYPLRIFPQRNYNGLTRPEYTTPILNVVHKR